MATKATTTYSITCDRCGRTYESLGSTIPGWYLVTVTRLAHNDGTGGSPRWYVDLCRDCGAQAVAAIGLTVEAERNADH